MKNLIIGLTVAAALSLIACSENNATASEASTSQAPTTPNDESDDTGAPLNADTASKVVQAYSKAVACQLDDSTEYKPVEIRAGDPELDGLGALYLVLWNGDFGCMGGNATVLPNFTLVEKRGFSSADPIVVTDYEFPEPSLKVVTDLTVKDGLIRITGLEVGEDDDMNNPTHKATYQIQFDGEKFSKTK